MKKKLFVLSSIALASTPLVALAQVTIQGSSSANCDLGSSGTLFGLLCRGAQLINAIVPVLIALGVLFFVWGVITYVMAGDEEAKTAGRDRIIFGIIGLVVIVGLWGLVNVVKNTFLPSNGGQNLILPTVPVIQQ